MLRASRGLKNEIDGTNKYSVYLFTIIRHMNILCIFAVCLVIQLIPMDKLYLDLMHEIVRIKHSGGSSLHIQLLQKNLKKLVRQTSDKQATNTNA